MKGIANAIVKPIGGAVNGVINGVNWVLDKVGSDKQFALWEVPKFARGTGGIPKRHARYRKRPERLYIQKK